jgi:hypothetical protein
MPHRLVRTEAAVQTSPYHSLLQSGLPSRQGAACGHDKGKPRGPRGRPFNVEALASDRADAGSRVDAAIGEQAFRGCDEDAGGERIDRRADLVRRRE